MKNKRICKTLSALCLTMVVAWTVHCRESEPSWKEL